MDGELPPEMIFEVLIRSPLHILDKCKKVSNGWKNLIYDSTFFPFYLKRTGTLYGFFVQDISNTKYVSQFVGVDQTGEGCINKSWLSGDVRILGSSNQGIVCCEKRKDKNCRWYIGKPATGQWKAIPNPKLGRKTIGVSIIVSKSKPLRFKIIRLSKMEKKNIDCWLDTKYECEVFDSKTWGWRTTRSVYLHYDEFIDAHQPAIRVGEFVYWKTSWDNVIAFHVTQQRFDKFCLPQIDVQSQSQSQQQRLVEYHGGLGFSCTTPDGNVQLWLTDSQNNYEWTRKMEADVSIVEEAFTYPYLVGFCNNNTLFMKAFNQVVFFNVEDVTFTNKEIDYELRYARQFFQFCSDEEIVDFRYLDEDDDDDDDQFY